MGVLFYCLALTYVYIKVERYFGGGTVLVGAANKQDILAPETLEAGDDVSREEGADDVAQVGDIVDIGEGGGDKCVFGR